MKTIEEARELATTMVGIGSAHGTTTSAIFTAMDQPLGREVGNANEISESIDVLEGRGPADLTEVVYRLGGEMLELTGLAGDRDDARAQMDDAVSSGAAMERFAGVISAQGGDPKVLTDRTLLPRAPREHHIRAEHAGYVSRCDALAVGVASVRLGAGRERKEDEIDPGVAITVEAKIGDAVSEGDTLATIRYSQEARLEAALPLLESAWEISDTAFEPKPLILGHIRSSESD